MLVVLAALPVRRPFEAWQQRLAKHIARTAHAYFSLSCEVHPETLAVFASPDQRCVVGLEPHSVLPLSVIAFGSGAPGLPPAVEARERAALASSTIFRIPLVRHLWTWLGLDSVDRRTMRRLLDENRCVLLIPGGAAECLYLQGVEEETVLLSKRFGFAKMALQTGSHLVPAFAFGQTRAYGFWRARSDAPLPRLVARLFGFAPILFWGRWGTPIPFAVPIRVVVGAPIRVTRVEAPSEEQVAALLAAFITAMKLLFEAHKAAAGFANQRLVVL